jgi:hypothetical protein
MLSRGMSKPVKTPDDLINMNLPLLRLSGVKYVVTDGYLYAGGEPIIIVGELTNNSNFSLDAVDTGYDGRQEAAFRVRDYMTRMAFFDNYVALSDNSDALNYLSDPGFDILRTVIINAQVSSSSNGNKMFEPQPVSKYGNWKVSSDIDVPANGVLLFNTRYDPGWKASVDGSVVKIFRADYIQMGIFVDRGRHTVEFTYKPDPVPFMVSFYTVIAGISAGTLYCIYSLVFRRKKSL